MADIDPPPPPPSEASVFWGADPPMAHEALRVSDAERQRCAAVLRSHAAVGRLDLDELDTRLAAAYAAPTRNDIDLLICDLPHVTTPHPGAPAELARALLLQGTLIATVSVAIGVAVWLATGASAVFWPGWVAPLVALVHVAPSAARGLRPGGDPDRELLRRAERRRRRQRPQLADPLDSRPRDPDCTPSPRSALPSATSPQP